MPVLNVPFVSVISVPELRAPVRALPKVQPPPTPLNTNGPTVLPFVVIVLPVAVAAKVIVNVLLFAANEPPLG